MFSVVPVTSHHPTKVHHLINSASSDHLFIIIIFSGEHSRSQQVSTAGDTAYMGSSPLLHERQSSARRLPHLTHVLLRLAGTRAAAVTRAGETVQLRQHWGRADGGGARVEL